MSATTDNQTCINCQECCKWMTFVIEPPISRADEYIAFYKSRGCRVTQMGIKYAICVPSMCPQLTPFGCQDYLERPQLCKDYNGRTDPLIDCQLRRS